MPQTRTWLQDQIARYTYKPGWTLTLHVDPERSFARNILTITYQAPDSRNPAQTTTVTSSHSIPEYMIETCDADYLAVWLQDALLQCERHELDEWLQRDGRLVTDPHAPSSPENRPHSATDATTADAG